MYRLQMKPGLKRIDISRSLYNFCLKAGGQFPNLWGSLLSRVTLARALAISLLLSVFFPYIAQSQSTSRLTGVYDGTYQCPESPSKTMNLKLAIVASDDGSARGRFTFSQPQSVGGATGSFNLRGHYDASTRKFKLDPQNWNPPVPPGFPLLGVDGSVDAHGNKISGRLTGGCSTFQATRNEAESAALPKQPPAPPRVGGSSATPAAPSPSPSKP